MKKKRIIKTINDLQQAVENDYSNHRIKKLAVLFLEAMTDWPTFNQENIVEFIDELKDYYGTPLSTDKIDKKKLNLNKTPDVWRQSSGALIADMIDVSTRFTNESNFDAIVKSILKFYSQIEFRRTVEINGNYFNSLEGFYRHLEIHLKEGNCPWGNNLDSLDEIVSESFNYTENESKNVNQIIWINFEKSKNELTEKIGERKIIDIIDEIFSSNSDIKYIKPTAQHFI